MKTTISSKGQVVLPAELRDLDRIRPGQEFAVERISEGEYILRRIPPDAGGLVDWLRECPSHDWFEPIASESTDSL